MKSYRHLVQIWSVDKLRAYLQEVAVDLPLIRGSDRCHGVAIARSSFRGIHRLSVACRAEGQVLESFGK